MIIIKVLIAALMLCVSFVLIALSGFMNYKYGLTLGNTPENAQVFGSVSVALDLMKAMLPLVILILWREKKIIWLSIASLGFVGLMIFSLSNGFGFSMKNRTSTSQTADLLKDKRQDLRLQLSNKRAEKSALPDHRPVNTVTASLEATRQHRRWTTSDQCTNATVDKSRDFCRTYANMKAELSTSKSAALLNSQISDIQTALTKISTRKIQMSGDVQANAIASYFAISKTSAQTNMSIFLSFLSEFGSSFGLIFTSFYWNAKPTNPQIKSKRKPATRRKKEKPTVQKPLIELEPSQQPMKALPAAKTIDPVQSDPRAEQSPSTTPTEIVLIPKPRKTVDRKTQLADFINEPTQTVNLNQQIEPVHQNQQHDFGLEDFVEQTLVKHPDSKIQVTPLFRYFGIWCREHHIEPINKNDFIDGMNILLEQEPVKGSYNNFKLVA